MLLESSSQLKFQLGVEAVAMMSHGLDEELLASVYKGQIPCRLALLLGRPTSIRVLEQHKLDLGR